MFLTDDLAGGKFTCNKIFSEGLENVVALALDPGVSYTTTPTLHLPPLLRGTPSTCHCTASFYLLLFGHEELLEGCHKG